MRFYWSVCTTPDTHGWTKYFYYSYLLLEWKCFDSSNCFVPCKTNPFLSHNFLITTEEFFAKELMQNWMQFKNKITRDQGRWTGILVEEIVVDCGGFYKLIGGYFWKFCQRVNDFWSHCILYYETCHSSEICISEFYEVLSSKGDRKAVSIVR